MGFLQKASQAVEDGMDLRLPPHEATGELRDGVGVLVPHVFAVKHASRVERNVVAVLGGSVAERGFSVPAARFDHLRDHRRIDIERPAVNFGSNLGPEVGVMGGIGRLIVGAR